MYLEITLKGVRPAMMHKPTTVDPFHPITRKMKEITNKKRDKTDEDIKKLAELEFSAAIYHHPTTGPYWPADNLLACIKKGATKTRRGKKVEEAVEVPQDRIPLIYDGPRGIDELWAYSQKTTDGEIFPFRNTCPAKVSGKMVNRTRPIFNDWGLRAVVYIDPTILNRDEFEEILQTAGTRVGLSDWYPKYGRFSVESVRELSKAEVAEIEAALTDE